MKIIVGLVILAAFCLGMLCFHYCSSFFRSRRLRARFDRGRQGEEEAREYLCAAGFEILAEQAEQIGLMYVDEEEVTYRVRADFLVRRGRETAIVEVKTGKKAVKPSNRDTRRQLFEYARLYDVDTLYFFDAEQASLKKIVFPAEESPVSLLWRHVSVFLFLLLIFLVFYLFIK